MEEPIEQEIKREPHPLDIKPKPPLGKRLNKRLLGCAILVLGTVLAAIVFGINRRSAANAVVQTKGGTATTETVQAIPKTEAKTLISNLQKPTANATTPATASQAQPSGPANPPPADPSSLNKQPWQPVSGMRDTGFQRSFLQPSQTPSQSQQRRPETPAQEAARLEHEALYAPLTAKKQDAPKSGVPATSPETPIPGMPASSDIEQIASLAKSLIPSTQGAAQAAPDLSRLGGRGATPATFAEAARRHAEDDSLPNLRTGPLSPFEIKAGLGNSSHAGAGFEERVARGITRTGYPKCTRHSQRQTSTDSAGIAPHWYLQRQNHFRPGRGGSNLDPAYFP